MSRQFLTSDTSVWPDRFGSGADGALTISSNITDSTANTTFSGTSGASSGTAGSGTGFTTGNLILIHQSQGTGVGTWELNKISSVGSGTNWTLAYPLQNTYTTGGSQGGQVYLLKQYSSATINTGVTLTSLPWGGATGGIYAILCNGTITVTGTITTGGPGPGGGYSTAAGGFRGTTTTNDQGEGTAGAANQLTTANGNGGGGGAGTINQSSGGGGGNATSGGNGTNNGATPGSGGTSAGATNLTTMVFGGAGGAGSGNVSGSAGGGGYGGGIVILIGKIITVTGNIKTDGTDGQVGGGAVGAGGAGAGGSILFKGQNLTLGSSLVLARAGSAGIGSGTTGGTGSIGRIHADYSSSISGTTNPTIDSTQDNIFNDAGGGSVIALL